MNGHLPCPHEGCPGLEMAHGRPEGCGHHSITEGCQSSRAERDALRLAFGALAAIVREEFPPGHSLAEIAETWPPTFGEPITDAHITALRLLEGTP